MQEAYSSGFLLIGLIVLATVWLPVLLQRFPLSLPILAVSFGYAVFGFSPMGHFTGEYRPIAKLLLEFVLVIAVMGAGLKIDRPFAVSSWGSTWRLLGPSLLLTIVGIAVVAQLLLDIPFALALLLGSILSPTDPVLASNVQLGPPGVGEEGEVRFSLTSEAGLNDGLALPFVTLSLLLSTQQEAGWFVHWVLVDCLWKIMAAVAAGILIGGGITTLNHHIPEEFRMSHSENSLAALGVGLLVYGVAEWAQANGFVAVFVSGVTIRNTTRNLEYTRDIHSSAEQIEQLVMVLVLILFGGSIAEGLLRTLTLPEIGFGVVALLVIRPIAVWIGFLGSKQPIPMRMATGFFGIRGLGTLYYATYAAQQIGPEDAGLLWRLVGFVVLMSVFVYGFSATPIMRKLDALRLRKLGSRSAK